MPNYDAEANPATAHMFIVNPLSGHGADNLFSTHPSTANRIAKLREMPSVAAHLSAHNEGSWGSAVQVERAPAAPKRRRGPWG